MVSMQYKRMSSHLGATIHEGKFDETCGETGKIYQNIMKLLIRKLVEEVRLWNMMNISITKTARICEYVDLGFGVSGGRAGKLQQVRRCIETWKSWNVKRTTSYQTSPLNVWSVHLSVNIPRSKQILGYEVWSVKLASLIGDMFGWHVWREDLLQFHVKADPPAAIVSSWDELRIKLLGMMDFVDEPNLHYGRHWWWTSPFNLKSSLWTVRL